MSVASSYYYVGMEAEILDALSAHAAAVAPDNAVKRDAIIDTVTTFLRSPQLDEIGVRRGGLAVMSESEKVHG